MHICHSITAWCVLVVLSFYDTCTQCHRAMHYAAVRYSIVWSMGTIGISLYQHIVTARPSSVIGLKHNKCLFWYDVIYLRFMLSMLSIYVHCYDTIPSIMHNCYSITAWCVLVLLSLYDIIIWYIFYMSSVYALFCDAILYCMKTTLGTIAMWYISMDLSCW
jgi:hypothetical protein